MWVCGDERKLNVDDSGGWQTFPIVDAIRLGLQDSNNEKDHPELFQGWLSDNHVNDRKRRERRAREGFLALVL